MLMLRAPSTLRREAPVALRVRGAYKDAHHSNSETSRKNKNKLLK